MQKFLYILGFINSIYFANLDCFDIKQTDMDSMFINWNTATILSLENQTNEIKDGILKGRYVNRLESIKEYWGIKEKNDVNINSIRYSFLKILLTDMNKNKDSIYVIEANTSGASVDIRNFLIHIDSNHKAIIEFYVFSNGNWIKKGGSILPDFFLKGKLSDYITNYGKGFNEDDIIITNFYFNKSLKSEFFLYNTLSTLSEINKVLDTYITKNFVINRQ
jgi:hypothetical protein